MKYGRRGWRCKHVAAKMPCSKCGGVWLWQRVRARLVKAMADQKFGKRVIRQAAAHRTKPCIYFQERRCVKGHSCVFSHVDEKGKDWHKGEGEGHFATPAKAAPPVGPHVAGDKRAWQEDGPDDSNTPPWKRVKAEPFQEGRYVDKHVESSVTSPTGSEAAFAYDNFDEAAMETVYNWLHEERKVGDRKKNIFAKNAIQLVSQSGEHVYR